MFIKFCLSDNYKETTSFGLHIPRINLEKIKLDLDYC